ncbi:MAG: ubiquinol-cytochrome C chaperone [Rhodospirillales bacterium]|nr:ubiquinol-cytochrome C chaperone [Rhodospirillales bacterium]
MLGFFKTQSKRNERAAQLYAALVVQARQPVFYRDYAVPDTVQGRFEMVVLHGFLVWNRLLDEGAAGAALSQNLFNVMFRDLEAALREMGVGDMGVPRRMKRMMRSYKGRSMVYRDALNGVGDDDLPDVLIRTVYQGRDPGKAVLAAMTDYMRRNVNALKNAGTQDILSGIVEFVTMSEKNDEENASDYAGMVASV